MRVAMAEWAVEAGELVLLLALPLYVVVAGGSLVSLFAWRSRRPLAVVAAIGQWAASTGLWIFTVGHALLQLGWVAAGVATLLAPLFLPLVLAELVFDGAWRAIALLTLHLLAILALRPIGRWLACTDEARRWRALQPFLPGFEPPTTRWS